MLDIELPTSNQTKAQLDDLANGVKLLF